MRDVLTSLLGMLGLTLEPWMAPAIALCVMVVMLPFILRNMSTSRARRVLGRARFLHGEDRRAMEQQALNLAGARPMGLVAVAEEALKQNRRGLAAQAVDRLQATGKQRIHLRRLRAAVDPTPLPHSAFEAAALIDRLREQGLGDEAERRRMAARRRWPRDEAFQERT